MTKQVIRLGGGSAYEMDRIPPSVLLAEKGQLDYLCLDTLAERTLGLAQQRKSANPAKGYNPMLERRVKALWPPCSKNGVKIISNMGAANPEAATARTLEIIQQIGTKSAKVATILGDDVRDIIKEINPKLWETGKPVKQLLDYIESDLVAANVYLGAEPIVEALEKGADVVIGGRLSDDALFLAPMIYEFGWKADDWVKKGRGTVITHLLECSAFCSGGVFADPPYKVVLGLNNIGYPIAEVDKNGDGIITKVDGTGGLVTPATCKEQLIYEVHDPANYLTPDVTADFRNVTFRQARKDRVKVAGGSGKERPPTLKVTLGVWEGYIGEGQVGYAGADAYEHARLCVEEMIKPFLEELKAKNEITETRIDYIGVNSLFGPAAPEPKMPPNEVRLRVAARCKTREMAQFIGVEVGNFALMGPIGWGGATARAIPILGLFSASIPREAVKPRVIVKEVKVR